ncbi:hypothetical protein ACHHYP_12280 [Achlya hypogyna]|uniref:Uncharacterized protein n=1 Tax=Achlya hypogyna TaxID=1202772 RepID=A0A1V9YHF6_ACHHY|nr:hypothetical protein ACHHYP_12280 [Achlya hypogyna]
MCTDEHATPLTTQRAVVLYLSAKTVTSQRGSPAARYDLPSVRAFLDAVAACGCSAGVAATTAKDDDDEWDLISFKTLLGVTGWMAGPSMLQQHNVPHTVLTTMPSVVDQLRGVASVEHVMADDMPARVHALASTPGRSLTLIHVSVDDYSAALDGTLLALLAERRDTFFGVFLETPKQSLPSDQRYEARTLFPLPKQSWAKQRNEYITKPVESQRALAYAFYAQDQVRPDGLSSFNVPAMLSSGGYGILRIDAALAEVVFRLGYSPKYGA